MRANRHAVLVPSTARMPPPKYRILLRAMGGEDGFGATAQEACRLIDNLVEQRESVSER